MQNFVSSSFSQRIALSMPWYRKLHWQIITGHAYPTSLDRAIGGSNNYDADVRHVSTAGHGANDIAGIDQRCSLLVSTQ